MSYLSDVIYHCSKNRPSTFNELSFSLVQEINNKARIKRMMMRRRIRQKVHDRNERLEDRPHEDTTEARKDPRFQLIPNHYLQAYDDVGAFATNKDKIEISCQKIDEKDQQTTFQIYQLILKRKPIFKVEEARRKLKNKHAYKTNKFKQQSDKIDQNSQQEYQLVAQSPQALVVADEYIQQRVQQDARLIAVVQIKPKDEEVSIPKIDKIRQEHFQAEQELPVQAFLNSPVERQRISGNQSKSQVSQSRRRSSQLMRDLNNNPLQLQLEDYFSDKRQQNEWNQQILTQQLLQDQESKLE